MVGRDEKKGRKDKDNKAKELTLRRHFNLLPSGITQDKNVRLLKTAIFSNFCCINLLN